MVWAHRIIPPGWLLLALLAAAALHHWLPIAPLLKPPESWLGALPFGAGMALAAAGVGAFRLAGTPVIPFARPTALVTTGVYRVTRNPMYLGITLIFCGAAGMLGSVGALLPLPLLIWILQQGYIVREERLLAQLFGGDYLQYRHRVRRWL
ncbi:MAG TPA: isoprenylcysteine carboxylmethyltransferase family protein [Steroidobacteraceae bacterium]|jgi:protein-S-isoprenylcysteine O-methyltransferase Ste14|nr:isoprenylcysteine carboxylmethyltransferase family protein [Steroidobacteraceae bacterium]